MMDINMEARRKMPMKGLTPRSGHTFHTLKNAQVVHEVIPSMEEQMESPEERAMELAKGEE